MRAGIREKELRAMLEAARCVRYWSAATVKNWRWRFAWACRLTLAAGALAAHLGQLTGRFAEA